MRYDCSVNDSASTRFVCPRWGFFVHIEVSYVLWLNDRASDLFWRGKPCSNFLDLFRSCWGCCCSLLSSPLLARRNSDNPPIPPGPTVATPAYCIAEHNVGRMALSVANNATFGDGYGPSCSQNSCLDCFTYLPAAGCEYPKGSNTTYLFAGTFWIGAVVNRDTLVSTGADGWGGAQEFNSDPPPLGRR